MGRHDHDRLPRRVVTAAAFKFDRQGPDSLNAGPGHGFAPARGLVPLCLTRTQNHGESGLPVLGVGLGPDSGSKLELRLVHDLEWFSDSSGWPLMRAGVGWTAVMVIDSNMIAATKPP